MTTSSDLPPPGKIPRIPYRYTPPGAPGVTYLKIVPDDVQYPHPDNQDPIPPPSEMPPIPYRYTPPGAPCITYLRFLPGDFPFPEPEYLRQGMLQAEPIAESDQALRLHFSDQPTTLIDSGGYLFYDVRDPNRYKIRPDLYVAFDVNVEAIRRRGKYCLEEVGKPPEFALEVASPSTRRRDTGPKRIIYAQIGVQEYWRFDYTGGEHYGYPLAGDSLANGDYRPIPLTREPDGMLWGYSRALDLCLCAQGPRLLYYDRKTGQYLHNLAEETIARRQAVAARRQAAADRDAALAEVERLRAELQRLQGK